MSNNESKQPFLQRHNGKIALSAAFLMIAGIGYDLNYNEVELTDKNTGQLSVFKVDDINPSSKDGYMNIYQDHGSTPYLFRSPDAQAEGLEVGDCFNATVTGLYVAGINGDLDRLRAPEITEVPCPE